MNAIRMSLCLALCAVPAHAGDTPSNRFFLHGATADSQQDEVAILVVNEPVARARDFACAVVNIGTRDDYTGALPGGVVLVVLPPGRYGAVYDFQTHLRSGVDKGGFTVEAGKRYSLYCAGATYNRMALRLRETTP